MKRHHSRRECVAGNIATGGRLQSDGDKRKRMASGCPVIIQLQGYRGAFLQFKTVCAEFRCTFTRLRDSDGEPIFGWFRVVGGADGLWAMANHRCVRTWQFQMDTRAPIVSQGACSADDEHRATVSRLTDNRRKAEAYVATVEKQSPVVQGQRGSW